MANSARNRCSIALIVFLTCLTMIMAYAYRTQKIKFGVIVPKTVLVTMRRAYEKKVNDTIESLVKKKNPKFSFLNKYKIAGAAFESLSNDPSPMEVLTVLCDQLREDVIAILYFTNDDSYGSKPASAQYLLQLTGYVGMPVIAWNADNAELQEVGGYDDFVRSVRDQVIASSDFSFTIIDVFIVKKKKRDDIIGELDTLAKSEARIILLYCNKDEAGEIMAAANELKITGKNYVWVVAQAVVGDALEVNPPSFPPGMLGMHFNTSIPNLLDEIRKAVTIFVYGLELFVKDPRNANFSFTPNLRCNESGQIIWKNGPYFFKHLRMVNVTTKMKEHLIFNPDGALKYAEIEIVNLNKAQSWDKVGYWSSNSLTIKDIVWPGDSTTPPAGVPEKFNLKVTFMDEPPYINIVQPDNETGECNTQRAVRCRIAPESAMAGLNYSEAVKNPKFYTCCAGFCIDLLQKFANDLGFTYDLYRVEDQKWGAQHNGTWNGLIADLIAHKADIVVTSIKINSERQKAVDFTVPFLETGIAIVVAKRTGIISPKAFLEPFDTISWIMILFIFIQVSAFCIFLFEWLSPSGYNMNTMLPRDHKFSLFRTYWLVWAILFGAAVNVDCPRGYTSRFMANVWAMFAVVFLAIYTANLAAFMITREEYYDLTGIEDKRLQYPMMVDPPFRYGTIPHGNTETVLKKNKPDLYLYMKKHNRPTVREGIKAVKTGQLDAFIYDSTVLEYWVGQDNECRLLTVGSWYAMTGYGFALPKKSKYLNMFNSKMIKYRENGDLERLQRFWLQGACKPTKNKRHVSKPLDVNQFMSAFLLLGCGVLLTIFLLCLEHLYFRYIRKHLRKRDRGGCFTLISLSIGKSLSFRGAVFEAQDMLKHHRCKDPICDTQLWKTKHELDMANLRIRQLEAEIQASYSSPEDRYFHDLTRSYTNLNERYLPAPPRYQSFCRTPSTTEVAEIETVL